MADAGTTVLPGFRELLLRRRALWWDGCQPQLYERLRDTVHRASERRSFRSRNDVDSVWHCCRCWPRTLVNKWNGREFVARHDGPVPKLFWYGSDPKAVPWDELPDAFVIRPVFGAASHGAFVVVGDRELLHEGSTARAELSKALPRTGTLRRPAPFLIEEYVRSWEDRDTLPLEYKCHTFGGVVGAVQVIAPRKAGDMDHGFYTPAWERLPGVLGVGGNPDPVPRERPASLEEMLALAARLGTSIGTYMRIDFFATVDGFVFNEFSSMPYGAGRAFDPFYDNWFGRLWAETIPGRL